MARIKLDAEAIANGLKELNDWQVSGIFLKKRFEFENFARALEFVNKAGEFAEKLDHHPDIKFGWGYAEFEIITHDTGGLTHNDFDLAKAIDGI